MECIYPRLLVLIRLFSLLCVCIDSISARKIAFIIIDVQNCFLPGGSLAVTEGDGVIPVINSIRLDFNSSFSLVVLSQDWHCSDHVSFASQHPGYTDPTILLQYDINGTLCNENYTCTNENIAYNLTQVLWPDHCVINTTSAEFSENLTHVTSDVIIRKGYNCHVDSYSAFYDNGGFRQTELKSTLESYGIDTVFISGLARDYCVFYTAKDAQQLGYETYVVLDATRPVAKSTGDQAVTEMRQKGIHIIDSSDMRATLQTLTSGSAERSFVTRIYFIAMVLKFALF